jgi:hypothetical protein
MRCLRTEGDEVECNNLRNSESELIIAELGNKRENELKQKEDKETGKKK